MNKGHDRLNLLRTFVRISDAVSISAAARDLGLSQPTASRHLADLESHLKAQLMRRTTHSLALTAAGRELLAEARQMLGAWEALEEKFLVNEKQARGRLTVVAPVALGQLHLMQLVSGLLEEHPQISLAWLLEDRVIRFSEVGCDCWIKIGSVPDETLVVKRVGEVERLVVADASFWSTSAGEQRRAPSESLPWLVLDPFEGSRIPLRSTTGESLDLQPRPRLRTNNIIALREAVLRGLGVAILPRWFIDSELQSGRLVDCWPSWRAPTLPVHLARLPGRHQPRRLTLFFDCMRSAIPSLPGISPAVAAVPVD
ncbi:MAG: LysR family transcriptional regulator [Acidobacteriota bacterium]